MQIPGDVFVSVCVSVKSAMKLGGNILLYYQIKKLVCPRFEKPGSKVGKKFVPPINKNSYTTPEREAYSIPEQVISLVQEIFPILQFCEKFRF